MNISILYVKVFFAGIVDVLFHSGIMDVLFHSSTPTPIPHVLFRSLFRIFSWLAGGWWWWFLFPGFLL